MSKRNNYILIYLFILFLSACSSNKVTKQIDTEYKEALIELSKNNFSFAGKKFEDISLNQVYLDDKVIILSAFSYYKAKNYDYSIDLIELFEEKFPMHKEIVYMNYLKILNYFSKIKYVGKSTEIAKETYNLCKDFIQKYSNSIYYEDIKNKMNIVKNYMVANELDTIRFNLSKANFIPALKRLDEIKKNYDDSLYRDEVYFRYLEIYKYIGYDYNDVLKEIKGKKWLELTEKL